MFISLARVLFCSFGSNGFMNPVQQSFQGIRYPGISFNGMPIGPQYSINRQQFLQQPIGFQRPVNLSPLGSWTNGPFTRGTPSMFGIPQTSLLNSFQFPDTSPGFQPGMRTNDYSNRINGMSVSTPLQTFADIQSRNGNFVGRQAESTSNAYSPGQGYQGTSHQPASTPVNYQKTNVQTPNFHRFTPGMSNVNQPTSVLPLDNLSSGLHLSSNTQPSHGILPTYYTFGRPFSSTVGMPQGNIPMVGMNVPQQNPGLNIPSLLPMVPQPRNKYNTDFNFHTNSQTRSQNYINPSGGSIVPQQGQVYSGLNFPSSVVPHSSQRPTGLNFPSNVPVAPQLGQRPTGLNFPSNVPVAPQPGQRPTGLNFPSNVQVIPQPGQVHTGLNFRSNVPVAPQPTVPSVRSTPNPPTPTQRFTSCPALNDPGEFLLICLLF